MFENEMFSREQGLRLAASIMGFAIPAGILLLDPRVVDASPEKLRVIAVADELSLLTFLFAITGVLAVLAWHSLFPSRGDYLALASLPIQPQQIFGARLVSVALMAIVVSVALSLGPSVVSPHNYGIQGDSYSVLFADIFARVLSTSLGCLFLFFSVVAIQGLIINLVPGRWTVRVTAYLQASLITVFFFAGLSSFISQGWQQHALEQLSNLERWAPPVWFASLHSVIMGHRQASATVMAIRGLQALGSALFVTGATYFLALHRYQQLMVENRNTFVRAASWRWNPIEFIIRNPRQQAVIDFMLKVFTRSRIHRFILFAHFGAGLAVMAGVLLFAFATTGWPGWRHILPFCVSTVPIGISFVMLTGVRYSFLLPVQLRANWVFQLTESQGRKQWLSALEQFITLFVMFPVLFLTFLVAIPVLGWHVAIYVVLLQTLVSCCMFELLFNNWQQFPFACSYVPAKSQLATVIACWAFVLGFLVPILGKVILTTSRMTLEFFISLGVLLGLWWWFHTLRHDGWGAISLVYEDKDDIVPDLGIGEAAYAITRGYSARLVEMSGGVPYQRPSEREIVAPPYSDTE